uniref:Prolyl 4-hydroxylase alpha subunit Fe(2+) 2OG dioxygenase domain-containing protein n=1 Tax=Pseudo-nitzschia australis TaxID=44445 RepID=A0A7S4EQ41_9STRA
MHDDLSVMEQIVQGTSLKAIGSTTIAFSIDIDYHSKCHINVDMFYTLATVVGPDKVNIDEIIHYFLFPTYGENGTKVPLQSGDTLLFNPSIPHSCSNPKRKGSFIMSAYVSKKTVLNSNKL